MRAVLGYLEARGRSRRLWSILSLKVYFEMLIRRRASIYPSETVRVTHTLLGVKDTRLFLYENAREGYATTTFLVADVAYRPFSPKTSAA